MNEKTEKVVVTFSTSTDAAILERSCREKGIEGRIVPVPRDISASCGLCWISPVKWESELRALIACKNICGAETYHRQMY